MKSQFNTRLGGCSTVPSLAANHEFPDGPFAKQMRTNMNTTITQSSPKLEFLKQLTPGFWTSVLSKTLAVAILAVGGLASAQSVPSLMNYQGKLVDGAGNPMVTGSYDVVFKIWKKVSPADPADALVWGQTNAVTLVNGIFNLALGGPGGVITSASNTNLVDAFEEANRYLSLTIVRNPSGPVASPREMLPRQQMLSAPFALRAAVAAEASSAVNGVPPGCTLPFAGVNVPSGFLFCDGSAVSRTDYANLFAALGTAYGAGDGYNTFNLPDLRGRVAMGGGQGTGLSNRSLGQKLGEETHILTVAEMPSHTHTVTTMPSWDTYGGYSGGGWFGDPNTLLTTSATGGDSPHNVIQPSLVINYIIKY